MAGLISLDQKSWFKYFDLDGIVQEADRSLEARPVHITDKIAARSPGGIHDYYSNGDYWWPNPATDDGLPYVRRDGESNPANFDFHRMILRSMRTHVAGLVSAFRITGDEKYAACAVQFLKTFFLDGNTRMNPHLTYAQSIPGVCEGRGIGIIDTLHLIDVAAAIQVLGKASRLSVATEDGLKRWFADYLQWMCTHPYGMDERSEPNNHGICWFVQAAAFARLTGNRDVLDDCKEQFKSRLLPEQMDVKGSFPRELARTKPYAYSMFALDNMVTLCHLLSDADDNLWTFELSDGRGIKRGLQFMYRYMTHKAEWPYRRDIEHDADWPAGMSFILFSGLAYNSDDWIRLWRSLDKQPANREVRRNMAIRQPLLWL